MMPWTLAILPPYAGSSFIPLASAVVDATRADDRLPPVPDSFCDIESILKPPVSFFQPHGTCAVSCIFHPLKSCRIATSCTASKNYTRDTKKSFESHPTSYHPSMLVHGRISGHPPGCESLPRWKCGGCLVGVFTTKSTEHSRLHHLMVHAMTDNALWDMSQSFRTPPTH